VSQCWWLSRECYEKFGRCYECENLHMGGEEYLEIESLAAM